MHPSVHMRTLASAALLVCATNSMAAAGTPAPASPLRPGMWMQYHTQSLNGVSFDVPAFLVEQARQAGVDESDDGRSERLCLTPQNIASIGDPGATTMPACRKQNVHYNAKGMSMQLVCSDETGSGQGFVNVSFDGPTAYHGTFEFAGTHQLFGDAALPVQISGTVRGQWLAPSCKLLR